MSEQDATVNAGTMLSTHDLQKRFGGVQATDGVSLRIQERELRCIIGPNGAGKSTLFALLAGIHRPDHGRIVLKGDDVTRLPAFRRVRRGLGLTFQTNRALHALTVRENLDTAPTRRCRAEAWDLYTYALGAFDLNDDLDCIAAELPHHKLHWLEICMVLASGPDLLMLDEPTAGMSPEETRATAEVIRALNARGLTMIVVEHDMSFVREIAKTVTVLHQGRIFAEGEMDSITSRQDVRDIYLGRVRAEA